MRQVMYEAQRALASPVRNPRMATVIGRLLGLAFVLCFGTGLYSHFLQEPLPGMHFATRPELLYQFTQGTHIIAGIACFPLLLAKLYIVFPDLFQQPPVRSFLNFLERGSIALFVGASLVQITIGLLNTYQWYPWPFPFRETHFALGWVLIGSLALHIGIKLPIIARVWRKQADDGSGDGDHLTDAVSRDRAATPEAVRLFGSSRPTGVTGRLLAWIDATPALRVTADRATGPAADPTAPARTSESARHRLSRRGFLTTVGVSVGTIVVLTAGQTVAPLDAVNAFAPRKKGVGQQGVPVNRTSKQADVAADALAAGWVLTVAHAGVERSFSRSELLALPQTEVELPIACVEGWSQLATWRGVRLRDLADLVSADAAASFHLTSLEKKGAYRQTTMGSEYVRDPLTLVALELNGETLDLEHGYPARMIAPGRPGVLQTKWLSRIEAMDA
ncbi:MULTISPECIES: molybdopterin-dependent oxidoreductase [unclassified Cryobacterium]|uniref:molybdopterin-dependent oxidoreductase n=1 Tax=unclassified Cryobacterium TaxID=2649013 RepID=UPI002AB4B989|nr:MULTISPECIES: molybdopterin-dependent oxidoreductase [unclassified Cryobacterium]MDY7542815.1 molybdopterin-dependent oxidoreductase [Cryobacterium sp. 5B3]MEA9998331.1 molybdopterin-dependent oxidoreductase [Cryobacterium sp. RTS3]